MIRIPTPFNVGDVNVYVLGDTLIDTGPSTEEAFAALQKQVDFDSISNILITHGHVDHHGLAHHMRKIIDCSVFAHRDDSLVVSDYKERLSSNTKSYEEFLKRSGVSGDFIALFRDYYMGLQRFGEDCQCNAFEDSFETSEGTLEIIHTPGHTPGSCCFLFGETLYSGDTLLPDISTNPSINAVFDERCGLKQYKNSLEKILNLKVRQACPGHGDIIKDCAERIYEIFKEHDERRKIIEDRLGHNPVTLEEISRSVFGDVPATEKILALAECYDHLRILEDDDIVEIQEDDVYLFKKK